MEAPRQREQRRADAVEPLGTRSRLKVAVAVVCAIGLGTLVAPSSARAGVPNPVDALGGVIDAGTGALTGGVAHVAVDGFGGIVKTLFAWPTKLINRELLAWLVAVPDYAIHPSSGPSGRTGSNLAELQATTQAMAFAALGAVGTVAGVRFWAAGLIGSGGIEALEGLARTVVAALAIVLWPWLFRHGVALANAAGMGLLGSGSVLDDSARMLAAVFAAAVAFNVLSILIALAAAVLLLLLVVAKIAVSAGTALVFVAMPLALLVWPLPELAWVARAALRMFAVVVAVPLAWAACFATFAAVGVDAMAFKGAGGVADALVKPLVALALLWLAATLPRSLARTALSGAGSGGGFASRTTSRVVSRRIDRALVSGESRGVGRAPGQGTAGAGSSGAAAGGGGAAAGRGAGGAGSGQAATAAAAAGTGGTAAIAAGVAGVASRGGWRPPPGPAQGASAGTSRTLRRPSWQEIRERVPVELDAAERRQASTTPRDVLLAMRSVPHETARAIRSLMEDRGGQIRGQMAVQAARSDISEDERDAFRTIAAASPGVRTEGIAAYDAAVEPDPPVSPLTETRRSGASHGSDGPAAPAAASSGAPADANTFGEPGASAERRDERPGVSPPPAASPGPRSFGAGNDDGAATPPPRDPLDGDVR